MAGRNGLAQTIAALATPPGRGGIGIVRLSGPLAFTIAARLFQPARAVAGRSCDSAPQTPCARVCRRTAGGRPKRGIRHGLILDPADGRAVDDIVLLQMPAPGSYTGEDVVEFQCHGSPRVLAIVLRLCLDQGARAAGPGEFTLRAFRNGRIDLTQAEAVMGLVAAETEAGAKLAAAQAQGALGRALSAVSARLVELAATFEAGIDFPDDEVPPPPPHYVEATLAAARTGLEGLVRSAVAGRMFLDGAVVTITGPPNVGKSSLFNALLGHDRAIVAETPGTTRDVVEARADWQGIPVTLRDTAGLRESGDPVETAGVRLAHQALADTDLVLWVWDVTAGLQPGGPAPGGAQPAIMVANKIDLARPGSLHSCALAPAAAGQGPGSEGVAGAARQTTGIIAGAAKVMYTSATTGQGIDDLRSAIVGTLTGGSGPRRDAVLLTTARQEREVGEALRHVDGAIRAFTKGVPPDVMLVEVYAATAALAAARGRELADVREDVVQEVFARFCVGK